jgi:uncharacterized protein (DUF1330 family)
VPAYVIASVRSADGDPQALADYRDGNTQAVANHGGEFLVRGGPHAVLEGGWDPLRVVVMRFPDAGAARGWYESDDYRPLRELRQTASETDIVLVEGV